MTDSLSLGTELYQHQSMAAARTLKAAKKELRMMMKERLSAVPKASLDSQSVPHRPLIDIDVWPTLGKKVFETLLNLRQYQEAKRISVYLSMPSGEVQTDEIVRHALRSGKDVFVPYLHKNEETTKEDGEIAPKKIMDMVKLKGLEDYERLERDSWGIPTVTDDTVGGRERILGESEKDGKVQLSQGLDLVLVPGVAFDLDGQTAVIRRLGHGKGFYDYFLHRYRSHYGRGLIENAPERPPLQEFGLALEEQFLQDKNLTVPVGPHDSIMAGLILGNGEVLRSRTFAV